MRTAGILDVAAANVWLPDARQTSQDAIAAGELDPDAADELGYVTLPIADLAAPHMAVLAAQEALEISGISARELRVLAHAWSYHQGHDFWSPAHYLAEQLVAPDALPVGIQQMCNGGAAALELTAGHLIATQVPGPALVTSADRFCLPGFHRWCGDYGVAYGDAASAVVLAPHDPSGPGLELLSISSVSAPEFEGMHRGTDPFSPAPRWYRPSVDARATKKAFLTEHPPGTFDKVEREQVRSLLRRSLADGHLGEQHPAPRLVLLPRLGRATLDATYRPLVAELTAAEPIDLGTATGHLGAGDLLAGLAELCPGNWLRPGETALVLSAGAGFSWSSAAVLAKAGPR